MFKWKQFTQMVSLYIENKKFVDRSKRTKTKV